MSTQVMFVTLQQAKEVQRARDLIKERDVLDALNAQMRANQKVLKERHAQEAAATAAKLAERDAQVLDLKEQVLCTPEFRSANCACSGALTCTCCEITNVVCCGISPLSAANNRTAGSACNHSNGTSDPHRCGT